MKKRLVVYIVGDSRSGSTLLENILSKSEHIVSVGELHRLKSYLIQKGVYSGDWNCGCGTELVRCSFWKSIIDELGLKDLDGLETMVLRSKKWTKQFGFDVNSYKVQNKSVVSNIDRLYDEVARQSRSNVIIDSSKLPSQAYWISQYSSHNVKFIILRRELPALVLSKLKWMGSPEGFITKYKLLFFTVLYQRRVNYFKRLQRSGSFIEFDYKDLANNPKKVINSVVGWLGIQEFGIPETMYLENDHTIGGTPNKFTARVIKYDDSWRRDKENTKLFRIMSRLAKLFY